MASLFVQRRKRQEISGKVGEPPAHLAPSPQLQPSYAAPPPQVVPQYQPQQYQPQQNAYAPPLVAVDNNPPWLAPSSDGRPSNSFPPLPPPSVHFEGGAMPPPNFGNDNYLLPTAAPPPQPSNFYQPSPMLGGQPSAPGREVRSAGLVPSGNAFKPLYPSSPRLGGGGAQEMTSGEYGHPSPSAPAPDAQYAQHLPQPDMPAYGRRARTTEVSNRDLRQMEYQREIQQQAEEAKERKRLERERERQEDEALERRVQQDRTNLANKERMEREKEVREREEKEAAALGGGKRRGGNNPPPQQNMSDHQKELLNQIEEKKRLKAEEEDRKKRDDEKYERKYSSVGLNGQPPAGNGADNMQRAGPSSHGLADGGMFAQQQQQQQQQGPSTSASDLPWMQEGGRLGSNAGGPAFGVNASQLAPPSFSLVGGGQPSTNVFNMMDPAQLQRLQQQQAFFPQPSMSSPMFGGGGYQQQPSGMVYPGGMMQQSGVGYVAPGGFMMGGGVHASGMFAGGLMQQPNGGNVMPMGSAFSPMFGGMGPGAGVGLRGNLPMQQQQQPNAPNTILQRFLDDDANYGGAMQAPQPGEDISTELPSEPSKFVGGRRRW